MDLKLDAINTRYFELLKKKHSKFSNTVPSLHLADSDQISITKDLAYSTAIAPPALLKLLPTTTYETLQDQEFLTIAKNTELHRMKMYAGIGSSIQRASHIKKHSNGARKELGAKGTDLFLKIPHPLERGVDVTLSLAEAQILQGIFASERQDFAKVVFEDLVSQETADAVEAIWQKPCLLRPTLTYNEYVKQSNRLARGRKIIQSNLPTFTEDGKPSFNRLAPGGHAFFGYEILIQLLNSATAGDSDRVSFLSNGEDLAACPDPLMVGWMVKNQIPLCMVVTEKTEIDRKGGQLAIVTEKGVSKYVTLIETAQAKAAGQLPLFEELGLSIKRIGQSAYFNTNMALFNERVLQEKLSELKMKLGPDRLMNALAPDLIHNWKEQTDADGITRRYLQLEGAMGSVFLNLDKLSRETTGSPLVHFLMVSKKDRSKFFAPIKSAFDLYLQYYSGKYGWDPIRCCPVNKNPSEIMKTPADISDDVETVLNSYSL